jgi:hypothetical protein
MICTKRISKTTFETSSCSLRTSPNKSSTSSPLKYIRDSVEVGGTEFCCGSL